MLSTHDTAKAWRDRGHSVIPIGWRDKRPAFGALKLTGNGHGPTWEQYRERLPTDDELRAWFSGPRRNLGIVTGMNLLTVLDFDSLDVYRCWQSWANHGRCEAARLAQETYRVRSARGIHLYLKVEDTPASAMMGAIDIKGKWGYVLAPPSIHPTGHAYQAEGTAIMYLQSLDVLPPYTPVPVMLESGESADPWHVASHAAACGLGAVQMIKDRLRTEDILGLAQCTNRAHVTACPIHADTHPSFYVYPDGGWHCFGCGAHGGDVIDLYAAMHKLSNREAIAALSCVGSLKR